jgi:uncharacterized protein YecE (DUF72 family)
MEKILIGTCGYGYTEWVGPVYPEGTRKDDFLRLYAGLFPSVELDFSYYAMPKAQNLQKMLTESASLTFSIKAHKTLTHEVNSTQWEGEAKTYKDAIKPLIDAGRLEAILFQFPYSFHYTDDNRRYLDKLLTFFKDAPSAVEFRVADWYTTRVFDALQGRGVSLVSLDMPELKGLPPLTETVTAKTAYIRLHGRNAEKWWGSDSAARYDYLYKDSELEAWADRITRIAVQADRILVYFNNHARGQAVVNAKMLVGILQKAGLFGNEK